MVSVAVLLGLFLLYFLSMGPVFVLLQDGALTDATYKRIYRPFEYFARGRGAFSEILDIYLGLWAKPESIPGIRIDGDPTERETVSTNASGGFTNQTGGRNPQ